MERLKQVFLQIMAVLGIALLLLAVPQAVKAQEQAYASTSYVTMYRLYNPYSGEHLYTKDSNEVSVLTKIGWKKEGEAWKAATKGTPVYRLYNPNNGDHHYTLDRNEYDTLGRIGWRKEGIAWYSDSNKGVAVYRLFNPSQKGAGSHHYTTDKNEYKVLKTKGWNQEGISWYGVNPSSSSGTTTTTTPKTDDTTTTTPKTDDTTTTTPKTDDTTTTTPKTDDTVTITPEPDEKVTEEPDERVTEDPEPDEPSTDPEPDDTTTAEPEPQNEYTYELYTTASTFYSDYATPIYIKTDNPDYFNSEGNNSFWLASNGPKSTWVNYEYDDVKYLAKTYGRLDVEGNPYQVQTGYFKVEGGYLVTISFGSAGTYTLSVTEDINGEVKGLGEVTITVVDSDQLEDEWQYSVINEVTTDDMDPFEKMEAISKYLLQDFKYLKNNDDGYVFLISEAGIPYFIKKEWDSCTSPMVLCEIAEKVGGFDDIHDCYDDYTIGSDEWYAYHYYAKLTIGDEVRYFQACPFADTNIITNVTPFDFTNLSLLKKL